MAGLFLTGVKSYAVDALTSQLPTLVETAQPQIESALRKSLRTMRAKHPKSAQIFAANWAKLNIAVQEELTKPASFFGSGKRTRKTIKRRKQRTNV
jgi:hypothetical protein